MIRVRTPLRIPFAGGLTDVKWYAHEFGGTTVSATISLGVLVEVVASESGRFEIVSGSARQETTELAAIGNDLVREALRHVDPAHPPVRLRVTMEASGQGGLGSSGAIAVALLHALRALRGESVAAEGLADEAAHLEVEVLAGNSGYHDPHICARGGLQRLDYAGARVSARRVTMPPGFQTQLEESLLLFATGSRASTRESLQQMNEGRGSAVSVLHDIKALAGELESQLVAGDLQGVARCIAEQQRLKQRLPGAFYNELVEDVTSRLEPLGVACQFPGGKVGGYVLVCCPAGQQPQVRTLLGDLEEVELRFTGQGSLII